MSAFLKGENLSLNLSVLLSSFIVAAVYQQVCMKRDSEEGDEETPQVPQWKKYVMYSLMASTTLLAIPVVYGLLYPKKPASAFPSASSFGERVAEASNSLSQSLEEQTDASPSDDFQKRVQDAANKLRSQIAGSPPADPVMPKKETASSLAAQASAEINRFIEDNS